MEFKHLFTAALIVSASAAAFAQQDTTSTKQQPQSQSQQPQSPNQQPSDQFNVKDYSQVQSSDLPASLRTTLQGDQYKGWENGKLYRQNNGNGYYLSTGTGTSTKNYYFDKDGKAMKDPHGGTNPRDNR
ncbi:hypothetical protein WBG78_07825 [Chryseolinea sp. T2]|uniref:hypothetical protein n=1 Tax=Chryseolinea sp. T2 TaxID=3129255 RepID=UPI0030788D55